MICPKCKSENVKIEMVTEQKFKEKKKGLLYWLVIGWWLEPLLWLFLTVPKLIYELFKPKKYKVKSKIKKFAICQNCGHSWNV